MTQAERVVNKLAIRIAELEKQVAILEADLEIAREELADATNPDQPNE